MHLKPAAGVFTTAFVLCICGPGLAMIAMRAQTTSGGSSPDVWVAVGGVLGIVSVILGVLLFFVAIHRALLKIDALPLAPQRYAEPPSWSVPPEGLPSAAVSESPDPEPVAGRNL